MKRIVVPVGCRSDEGLSAPIIKRLREAGFDVYNCKLEPQNFITSYQIMDYVCKAEKHIGNHNHEKPDLVLIVGDRVEMCAAAAAAFHNNVKIAHVYAGVINNPVTTYDDIDRHCITLWSDIQFVESEGVAGAVWDLLYAVGLKPNIHNVGITHLEDLENDESQCPVVPYDLVLLNENPQSDSDIEEIITKHYSLNMVLIAGNPDGQSWTKLIPCMMHTYPTLPRAQFLGLLKNCQRFISNSSCCIYEAPYFLKPEQIIMIGDRNKTRPKVDCKPGGSDRIVSILTDYLKE